MYRQGHPAPHRRLPEGITSGEDLLPYKEVDAAYIRKADAPHALRFAIRHFRENAYKLNMKTIIPIAVTKIKGYFQLYTRY